MMVMQSARKPRVAKGPNRTAAEKTVKALRDLGRVELVDEALVVAFVELAKAVDESPGRASLQEVYLSASDRVRLLGTGQDRDEFEAMLDELRTSVVDSPEPGA